MEVMGRRFTGCIVIAITHRLHTIRQYDRIVVLNQGLMVVPCKTPDELLARPSSYFQKVWDKQSSS
jgi:ABC-type multidrug transport system fused ATPase/permease subunit